MLSKSVNWAFKKKKNPVNTQFFWKNTFSLYTFWKLHFLKKKKKTQFQEAESNSPLMIM